MYRYCQYAGTAYNSRFIKDTKNRCKRIPCGSRWMLDVIKQVRYDYMLIRYLRMADYSNSDERHDMLRIPVYVAIDKHAIPRYDKTYNMLNIITSKFKSGTHHFNCLATINCTVNGSGTFWEIHWSEGRTLSRTQSQNSLTDAQRKASGSEC